MHKGLRLLNGFPIWPGISNMSYVIRRTGTLYCNEYFSVLYFIYTIRYTLLGYGLARPYDAQVMTVFELVTRT